MIPIILATLAVTLIFVTIAGIHEALIRLSKVLKEIRNEK